MERLRLLEAFSFAARKLSGQVRKDQKTPYTAHPFRVVTLLMTEYDVDDSDVLAAAVLHDTIEDTTTDREDISSRFGERVAEYVALLSQDARLPEAERERRYHAALADAPAEVKLCKLADTLDNLLDGSALDGAGRGRAVRRARHLVELLGPGLRDAWQSITRRVLEAAEELENVGLEQRS